MSPRLVRRFTRQTASAPPPPPTPAAPPAPTLTDDDMLTDTTTGLVWLNSDNGHDISWADAKSYCTAKGNLWRLPTVSELSAIFHEGEASGDTAPCGNSICKVTPKMHLTDSWFWTGSHDDNDFRAYWYFNLSNGDSSVYVNSVSSNNQRAICIRGH